MTLRRVLVELSVVEQRYQAVLQVLAGASVTEVAGRFGVSRQAVHRWLSRYREHGLAGLSDRSSRPASSPTQTAPEVEALICELRRNHPSWGARRLVLSANGTDPVNLAVEFTRVVPASANLAVCGQQFWLGTHRAGLTITLRADTTVVELLAAGTRIKKVPSRLTPQHLRRLLAEGATRIPPADTPARPGAGEAFEVDRTVNACGQVALGGRQHPVGCQFAGRRLTVRIEGHLLHLLDQSTLLRTLPNPLTDLDLARIRDARPAGPEPEPDAEPVRVQRRVSSRGQNMIAGQKIQVGIGHAGTTVTIEDTDGTFRITHTGQIIAEVARTTTKPIARFKARKPEPSRPTTARLRDCDPDGRTMLG